MNNPKGKSPRPNYQALWFIIYFSILLQGFRVLLQFYLQQDQLSFGYLFLLGIPSALVSIVIERFTSHRNRSFKILVTIILMTVLIVVNIGVRSIFNP